MSVNQLPTLNAILNAIALSLLVAGFIQIKKKNVAKHRNIMLMALAASALFLTSYLIYHSQVGSNPYPYYDWTRTLYFVILIPHIILAALMVPFILVMVFWALRRRFEKHKKLAHFVWPVCVFVSLSGIFVYVMLYLR